MKKLILLSALSLAAPLNALAASSSARADIDVHASTLGLGVGIATPLSDSVAGRLSFSQYSRTSQTTSDSINYDTNLKLSNIAALADWHALNGYFHLSAGLVYNNNELEMIATPVGGSYTINGKTYTSGQVGSMGTLVTFNKLAPYLGIGWSGRANKTGFSFKSDIGVLFQGSPKSTLSATGAAADPALAADVAAAQTKLDTELESYKYYPVISVGLAYAF